MFFSRNNSSSNPSPLPHSHYAHGGETAILLKGVPIKNRILAGLRAEVADLIAKGHPRPAIGIVQVGNNPRSDVYIHKKKTFGHEMGAVVEHVQLPETSTFEEISARVRELAAESDVHGVIIQTPLPASISKEESQRLMDLIPLEKDVDGLSSKNIHMLEHDFEHAVLPATAKAVNMLLQGYDVPVQGKNVVVIGRSNLVGKPSALSLARQGAVVTVCHSQTVDPASIARQADILVVAAGVPNLVKANFTNPEQTIIDVGISVIPGPTSDGRIVGDVDFKQVAPIVKRISPVPGGVGPLTVAGLFQSLLECYKKQIGV